MGRKKKRTDEFLEVGLFVEPKIKGFKKPEEEKIRNLLRKEPELRRRLSHVTIKPQIKGKASLGTTESLVDEDRGFVSENVTVRLNKELFRRPKKFIDVIAHEAEHALQHKAYTPEENKAFFEKDIQSNLLREEEAIDAEVDSVIKRLKPISFF